MLYGLRSPDRARAVVVKGVVRFHRCGSIALWSACNHRTEWLQFRCVNQVRVMIAAPAIDAEFNDAFGKHFHIQNGAAAEARILVSLLIKSNRDLEAAVFVLDEGYGERMSGHAVAMV